MISAATVALVAWGALAFGAVYPWAYGPLLVGCAVVGVAALIVHRRRPLPPAARPVIAALLVVLAATALQVLPLPAPVLAAVSPSTDAFLRNHDFAYALGGTAPDGTTTAAVWHPLSLNPAATLVALTFIAAFTLLLAGLLRTLSPKRARILVALVIAFGAVLALIGIMQKAMLGDHAWGGMKIYGIWTPDHRLSTPFGPYVNRNHFAGWMLMTVPLALGYALGLAEQALRHRRRDWRSWVLWLSSPAGGRAQMAAVAAFVMAAALVMTQSRSGAGAMAAGVVMMSLAARRRFASSRAGWLALGSLTMVFVAVVSLAGAELGARVVGRLDAIELRRNIWADSAVILRDFPLMGTGLNTFGTAMITYQTSRQDQHYQEAHNDYLQLLVEGGVLVGVPVFAAIMLAAGAVRRRFVAAEDDALTYWIRTGAATGLVAIALQSIVEFSLQMPGNAVLFVVLLAVAMHGSGGRVPHAPVTIETTS